MWTWWEVGGAPPGPLRMLLTEAGRRVGFHLGDCTRGLCSGVSGLRERPGPGSQPPSLGVAYPTPDGWECRVWASLLLLEELTPEGCWQPQEKGTREQVQRQPSDCLSMTPWWHVTSQMRRMGFRLHKLHVRWARSHARASRAYFHFVG